MSSTSTPGTASPTIAPAVAIRWSAYAPHAPPCSGRGRISRPSAVSSASPPSAVMLPTSAASRSVSWPRMWAIPRSLLGPSAKRASAAMVGVSSPTSCRSASIPASDPIPEPRPVTVRPRSSLITDAPMSTRMSAMASPGWVVSVGHRGTVTSTTGDRRGCQERRRVGQVRFDHRRPRRDRAGEHVPGVRLGVVDPHPDRAERRDGHPDVRLGGDGGTVVHHPHPAFVGRAGQQEGGQELRRGGGVDPHRPATQRTAAAHGERQRVPVDVRSEVSQCREHGGHRTPAGGLVAVEVDPSVGRDRERGQEPHDGAGQPAVDGGRPTERCRIDPPAVRGVRDAGAERRRARQPSGRCRGCAARRRSLMAGSPGRPGPARDW